MKIETDRDDYKDNYKCDNASASIITLLLLPLLLLLNQLFIYIQTTGNLVVILHGHSQ